jgi:predicted alpha/beta hydrolase family esterase
MTIILVHGYFGSPENCWFPWLRRELESRGHTLVAPAMPTPAFPVRNEWLAVIAKSVVDPSSTVLVGHSLGCLAILSYLSTYVGTPFPCVVLAAGFARPFLLNPLLSSWFPEPLNLQSIRLKVMRWTCIHSTNDVVVPYAEGQWLAEQLGATLVTEHLGHLTKRSGAAELPSVLSAILDT